MKIRSGSEDYLKQLKVLYIEDEDDVQEQFTRFLERIAGTLVTAKNGRDGLASFHSFKPDIVITDIKMPDMDGLELASAIRNHDRSVYIIVLTGFGQVNYLKDSINLGINRYLTKPVDGSVLHEALCECARLHRDTGNRNKTKNAMVEVLAKINELNGLLRVQGQNMQLETDLQSDPDKIIGESSGIQAVLHKMQQIARLRTTVLLTGETGTGKGRFARYIHDISDRRDMPFVHVNCAVLPANLIESELFGREKGAYTGSTGRQIGRFELAHGGTLFLDEISELPRELQAKFLTVIEDGESKVIKVQQDFSG